MSKSTATAADAQGHSDDECHKHDASINPLLGTLLEVATQNAWCGIEFPQRPYHYDEQDDEIPVVQQFGEEDATEVVLVAELAEDAGGGATQGVREVGRVAEVDDQRQSVHDNEQPLTETMIARCFLQV